MYLKAMMFAAGMLVITTSAQAQHTCQIIECEQKRAGEVCTIRSCQTPANLVCRSGLYTEGDGDQVFRGGTQGQCERRCAADQACNYLEYYFGREGVKCNLYYSRPVVRWNSNYDAVICSWR